MAQSALHVNGRTYHLGCEDGQEERLSEIATYLDAKVKLVRQQYGPVGSERLLVMAALLITDELWEARDKLSELSDLVTDRLSRRAKALRSDRELLAAVEAATGALDDSDDELADGEVPPGGEQVRNARSGTAPTAQPQPQADDLPGAPSRIADRTRSTRNGRPRASSSDAELVDSRQPEEAIA